MKGVIAGISASIFKVDASPFLKFCYTVVFLGGLALQIAEEWLDSVHSTVNISPLLALFLSKSSSCSVFYCAKSTISDQESVASLVGCYTAGERNEHCNPHITVPL